VARNFLLSENGKNFVAENIKRNIGDESMLTDIISAKEWKSWKNNWE